MKVSIHNAKAITPWLLLLLTLGYIVSGLGIFYFRIMGAITFGLLTKALSAKIHDYLLIPFLIVLLTHIFLTVWLKKRSP
jgi:hypothetical protein